MKRVSAVAVVWCLLIASTAQAQFFGQLGPLNPRLPHGLELAGAYLGLADSQWGLTGQLRTGLSSSMDAGLQAGFTSYSGGGTRFGARADLKGRFADLTQGKSPLVFGGNADVHFSAGEELTVFGFTAVPGVSMAGEAGKGQTLAGWAGFGVQVDFLSSNGESDNSTSGLLRLGGQFDFTREMGIVAEFNHLFANDGSDAFMIGLNYYLTAR
jgi:hypothetical protein